NLVNMHGELLNLNPDTAAIVAGVIERAKGIEDLAEAILDQAKDHQAQPNKPNWAVEQSWIDEQGKSHSRYQLSPKTIEWLKAPLADALRQAKNTRELESTTERPGCWTATYGTTFKSVRPSPRPPLHMDADLPPTYNWTVTELTPANGVDESDS